ncbi:hypothetical protein BDW62DRAFT_125090 [Aspergillus aurantiobrunneus]
MADHRGPMYSFYSSESDDDDTPTTTTGQDDCPGKTPLGGSSRCRRLFQKTRHSRARDIFYKGKELFQKIEGNCKIESIPLPLVKAEIQPGQEWVKGAMLCAWGTALIAVLNVILAVVAIGMSYSKTTGDKHFTYAELYQGDCSVTGTWTTGMHLVINVLSSILLAASNYVMQCLSAPSRADVDKAHSRGDWLDIGTLSLRNLWVMDAKRKIIWVLLLVSSLPIHMLYNTAIFSSISTVDYGIVVIPSDLGRNESLVKDEYEAHSFYQLVGFTPDDILAQRFNGAFRNLSLPDCINTYNVEYNTKASTLLLVTDRDNLHGSSSLASLRQTLGSQDIWMDGQLESISRSRGNSFQLQPAKWNYPKWSFKANKADSWGSLRDLLYPDPDPEQNDTIHHNILNDTRSLTTFLFNENPNETQLEAFLNTGSNWQNSSWAAQISFRIDAPSIPHPKSPISLNSIKTGYNLYYNAFGVARNVTISGCMINDADQHCQLYFSLPICLAVITCNIVKVFCMYMTARTDHREVFLTIGDALSSFLDNPDGTTRGHHFLSRNDMTSGSRIWVTNTQALPFNPINKAVSPGGCPQLLSKRKRWLQAASWRRWTFTYILFFICLAVSVFLYSLATYSFTLSVSYVSTLGIGKPNNSAILFPSRKDQNIIALTLLANTPQLVFSTLYLLCNGLFTCMLAVAEYNDFATQRKPLRVSWPKGEQRSTYYLSLPYRYSIPLVTVSVAMHWLISQCLFLVRINPFDVHGEEVAFSYYSQTDSIKACGYSPLAIFITIIVGAAAMTMLFGFSLRPLRSNMPLVSSCSAAISAACHPPPGDEDASLKPVMWGEIRQDSSASSCSDEATVDNRVEGYVHCSFTSKEVTPPSMV